MPPKDRWPKAVARCIHCGMRHKIDFDKHIVGETIKPYPGGGGYGRCRKCKREGLQIVEVPKIEPTKPAGWHKIPGG